MRLVNEIPAARLCRTAGDIEARGQMMAAAAMGAVAFQKGLGAIHALSHPVGAVYGTHHGTTNAVVMPMVLRFNRPAIEDRIAARGRLSRHRRRLRRLLRPGAGAARDARHPAEPDRDGGRRRTGWTN